MTQCSAIWRLPILCCLPAGIAAAQSPRTCGIPLTPCKALGGRAEAVCGTYDVFENRAAASGRKIKHRMQLPPFYLPDPKHPGMSAQTMADYAGTYELAPGAPYVIRAEAAALVLHAPNWPRDPGIFPISETRAFMLVGDAEIEFFRDSSGKVTQMVVRTNGRELKMARK